VVATGSNSEVGKIGQLVGEAGRTKTPLELRLERLGRKLVLGIFAITGLYVLIGLLQGVLLDRILLTGTVLAVAAVPEGLPAVATISLAIGVRRMARKFALVRSLPAAETLGSVSVICTDKTGTITKNEPTLREIRLYDRRITVEGEGFSLKGGFREDGKSIEAAGDVHLASLLRAGVLCNNAEIDVAGSGLHTVGDTTEVAILVAAAKAGIKKEPLDRELDRLWEDPFDPRAKIMLTVHRAHDGKLLAFSKGAPEAVAPVCARIQHGNAISNIEGRHQAWFGRVVDEMTILGLRVLALAYRELEGPWSPDKSTEIGRNQVFLGFLGIYDPPRENVREAVANLSAAGIKIVMVTGDHPVTAQAIASEVGISRGQANVQTGDRVEKSDPEQLADSVEEVDVFARVTPGTKLKIVRAYQKKGHFVAMTGDGVNDAPALKHAEIGIAMGKRGTDVAKEAADMIILDDNFTTIASAVEGGRLIYANIRRFIQYLFSCNVSEVLIMMFAVVASLPFPLLPLQLLWMNLTTDTFPALALAAEPADAGAMKRRPPHPKHPIIFRNEWVGVSVQSVLLAAGSLAAFVWALATPGEEGKAQTLAFVTLSLAQIFHSLNYSSVLARLRGDRADWNRLLIGAIILTIVLLLLTIYVPQVRAILETHELTWNDWTVALLASVLSVIVAGIPRRVKLFRPA
jgi:Ca2+-transporting ATPase